MKIRLGGASVALMLGAVTSTLVLAPASAAPGCGAQWCFFAGANYTGGITATGNGEIGCVSIPPSRSGSSTSIFAGDVYSNPGCNGASSLKDPRTTASTQCLS